MHLLAEGGGGLSADASLGPSAVIISEPLALPYLVSRHQNGRVSITCKAMYVPSISQIAKGHIFIKNKQKNPCSVLV